MTKEERNRAEQIRSDFPKWDRPMSTEESRLVERLYEIECLERLDDREYPFAKIFTD